MVSCLLVGSVATSSAAVVAAAVGVVMLVIMLRACNKCTRDHIFVCVFVLFFFIFCIFTIPTGTFESWATDFLHHFHKNIVVSAKYC